MKTEVIKLDAAKPDAELIKAAASIVQRGGLVAFPTETVYGIACKAQRNAALAAFLQEFLGSSLMTCPELTTLTIQKRTFP